MQILQNFQTEAPQNTTHLTGVVERITYHNEETGFSVLQVRVKDTVNLVTLTGKALIINIGETLEAQGEWIVDRRYGRQFSAKQLSCLPPNTLDNMQKYLSSGAIKGVGEHYANLLIKAFSENVFIVLDQEPERLMSISGIGKKRAKKIIHAWEAQKSVRHIMFFLQSHGIGPNRAVKIHKLYGEQAIEIIRSNPYRLIQDIAGIGFKIADSIGMKLGIAKDSLMRLCAGVKYLLQLFSEQGHCAAYKTILVEQASALLEVEADLIEPAIQHELQADHLIAENVVQGELLFLKVFYQAELEVAAHLNRLQGKPKWQSIDAEVAIDWVEKRVNMQLSASQKVAIQCALEHKLLVLTGGPGVGKTTVVNSLLKIISAKKLKIALCAPTGRAAKRLSETTGLPAKTIHRLLAYDPISHQFQHNRYDPIDADLVIVDEASMIDIMLMRSLMEAIPTHAGLFLIGDVDQLPSVGPGAVLSDVIAADKIKLVQLTEIFRQAETSQIIVNAHRVNRGEVPQQGEEGVSTDFYLIPAHSAEEINHKVVKLVCQNMPNTFGFDPLRDIQVLVPMNRGSVGTIMLNQLLQKHLNGHAEPKLQRMEDTFAPRDKVMQLVNNYDKDVFNGDIGCVTSLNLEKKLMRVDFDGRSIEYTSKELDELSLAYAVSIHKSQGSEYPAVVIPLASQHKRMLVRNLLYTAMTRGKKLVVIVAEPGVLAHTVKTLQTGQRVTRLAARINVIWQA